MTCGLPTIDGLLKLSRTLSMTPQNKKTHLARSISPASTPAFDQYLFQARRSFQISAKADF
jgi:hypothetical protein